MQVSLFGHLRINTYLQLPVAYRSLSRPSSSSRAKASPIRSYLLPNLKYFRTSRHARFVIYTTPPVKELLQPYVDKFQVKLRL